MGRRFEIIYSNPLITSSRLTLFRTYAVAPRPNICSQRANSYVSCWKFLRVPELSWSGDYTLQPFFKFSRKAPWSSWGAWATV